MNGFTERQREPSLRGRRAHVRLAVAAAVLTALLAAPASGQAAPVTVSTSAVNVHGYKLTLMAGGETGQTPTLSIQLLRKSHGVTQIYSYTFIRNITLTPAPDLSSATLTAALGRFGSVNMSFGSAGPPQMRALNNCPLVSTNRAGKLTGTFTLKLGGRFFRTITERTLPATLSSGGCTFGGSGGGPLARGVSTQFTASRITRSSSVRFTAALPRSGRVLEQVIVNNSLGSSGVAIASLECSAPRSDFTVNSRHTSATIKGGGKFSGTLHFSAPTSNRGFANGTVRGSLKAHFDAGAMTLRLAGAGSISTFGIAG